MQAPVSLLSVYTFPVGAGLGQRIVIDGPRGTIFEYNNTNALVGSWAAKAGTDPYGHAYPQGLQITGGSIIAGLFQGTNFIINSLGAFFYSGVPATGNLIASITPAAGADDGLGNAFQQGINSYQPSSFFSQLLSGQVLIGSNDPNTRIVNPAELTLADATTDAQSPFLSIVAPGVTGAVAPFIQMNTQSKDLSQPATVAIHGGVNAIIPFSVPGPITFGQQPGFTETATTDSNARIALVVGGNPETWHSLGALGGHYTVVLGRYKMTLEGELGLDIRVDGDGLQATSVTFANTLPAAYRPATTHSALPMGTTRQTTAGDISPRLTVDTAGNVTVINQGTNNTFAFCGRIPLD